MKNTLLSAIFIAASLIGNAQDNKPTKGDVGIWYGVSFVPVTQNVYITGYLSDRIEFGGSIGVNFSHNSASQFSTVNIFTNNGYQDAQLEHKTVSQSSTVSIAPMFLYHFKVKSNLDLGLGANLPVSINTGSKSSITDITTTSNYNSTTTQDLRNPVSAGIGAGMVISCKYFFYKNLAIGAMANLGIATIVNHGTSKITNSTTNTGSNNPSAGFNTSNTQLRKNSVDAQNVDMLHNFNVNLSWYFGAKKKKAAAPTAAL